MVLHSGWLSISYSSSYYFRTCPTEEWLLISFSDRHTAKMFSCTKHLIGLRWSHTCSGKLETGFFANKISINAKTAAQNSLRKITHLPVHGVKQLGSFESTWQIEDFSCKVKDSRRSGMYQSWHFWDKIGHAKSVDFRFYSAIWRSDSRISSRYLEATSISLIYYFGGARRKGFAWLRNVSKLTFFWQDWTCKVWRFSVLFYSTKWEPN